MKNAINWFEIPVNNYERAKKFYSQILGGGKVIMPKMDIQENGFIAQFTDTEGNRVAFHSMN